MNIIDEWNYDTNDELDEFNAKQTTEQNVVATT